MKQKFIKIVTLALLGFMAQPAYAAVSERDLAPFAAHEVRPVVHLLATPKDYVGPAVGNVGIIEQKDGFVLVDSGLTAGNGRTIVNYVRARSPKPVKAVVITHWHNDHAQGLSEIRAAWPKVRIIATEETRKGMLGAALGPKDKPVVGLHATEEFFSNMRTLIDARLAALDKSIADPATSDSRREQDRKAKREYAEFLESYRGTYMVPPTETFDQDLLIDDPDVPVRVMFLGRANTAGDAIVWLPKQRIVMSGDAVVWPTPYGFFSFPNDWIATLGRIKALDYAVLIPGHGEPQTDTKYIDQLVASIEDIRAQVGPLAKQGLTLEEVRNRVDFSRYARVFGKTERLERLFKAYWTDPMVENAWKEAKGLPIVQGEGEVTVAKQSERTRPATQTVPDGNRLRVAAVGPEAAIFVDRRDGHSYRTVRIAEARWFSENLRFPAAGSVCYGYEQANCGKLGRLYSFDQATAACPPGWRLPSDQDWNELEKAIGIHFDALGREGARGIGLGRLLRQGGASGFEGLLGGYSDPHRNGMFRRKGETGAFWTSTTAGEDDVSPLAWHRDIGERHSGVYRSRINVTYKLSVRCVTD